MTEVGACRPLPCAQCAIDNGGCGVAAICSAKVGQPNNGTRVCTCPTGYFGDPLVRCVFRTFNETLSARVAMSFNESLPSLLLDPAAPDPLQAALFLQLVLDLNLPQDGNGTTIRRSTTLSSRLFLSEFGPYTTTTKLGRPVEGFYMVFILSPPNVPGQTDAPALVEYLKVNGFITYYTTEPGVVNRTVPVYLEAFALFTELFDASAVPPLPTKNTTILVETKTSSTGITTDIIIYIAVAAGCLILFLLILYCCLTRKSRSKIQDLTTRKIIRIMAPPKMVWDPSNMTDWWTVAPTGEQPFTFQPEMWDPDNDQDWYRYSQISSKGRNQNRLSVYGKLMSGDDMSENEVTHLNNYYGRVPGSVSNVEMELALHDVRASQQATLVDFWSAP